MFYHILWVSDVGELSFCCVCVSDVGVLLYFVCVSDVSVLSYVVNCFI